MPETLLTQQPNRCVLIPVEDHGSLSTRLEPGDCVRTVAPISMVPLQQGGTPDDSIITVGESDNVNPTVDPEIIQDGDGGEGKALPA